MTDDIAHLLDIMAKLRDPEQGCPWDVEQTFQTIAPYTIEEAYEVAEAVRLGDMAGLCDELGDLLLQVVFHARMAEEAGHFAFNDVVATIAAKMIRRHPHVFENDAAERTSAKEVKRTWEEIKAAERTSAGPKTATRTLADVPLTLPALMRAVKLQKRAARVGFDWPNVLNVLDKLDEELDELREAVQAAGQSGRTEAIEDELGDVLFVYANLARHLDIDPEKALRGTNDKFTARFAFIEDRLAERGQTPTDVSLAELEDLWQQAKVESR